MTSQPTKVAIVGLDHWYTAVPLAREFANRRDTELVGIWDADPARARQIADQVGAPVADSAAQLIEDESVDVVGSFISTDQNPSQVVAAAKAGKHIVSIKPLARTLDEATTIVTAVREAGVVFIPAESRVRVAAHSQQLRTWVREGHFGQPLTANFAMWTGLPQGWSGDAQPGWFADRDRAPGGGWIDHSIYHIDLLRWLFDARVTSVSGTLGNLKYPDLPVEDYGTAVLTFDNGLVATIEDTWTAPSGGFRQQMSLVGTDAAIVQDSLSGRLSLSGSLQPFGGWVQLPSPSGFATGVDDILAVVRGESEPFATVDDAWDNLAACRAFYEAASTGTAVAPARM